MSYYYATVRKFTNRELDNAISDTKRLIAANTSPDTLAALRNDLRVLESEKDHRRVQRLARKVGGLNTILYY